MKIFFQNIILLYSMLIISCSSSASSSELSIQELFQSGLSNLEKEKYLKAQADFTKVILRGSGSDLGDDALYYLAESYYRNEEYLEAIGEYEKLTRRMGFSPFTEDARFKICEAYSIESPKYFHDQDYTERALERYQEFLDDYPDSKYVESALESIKDLREKMGLKLYESGILYMKMEEYDSAEMMFKRVLEYYYDTNIVNDAKQGIVLALANSRRIDDAILYLNENENSLKEFNLYNDAKNKINTIQDKLEKEKN